MFLPFFLLQDGRHEQESEKHLRRRDKKAAAKPWTQGSDSVHAHAAETTTSAQSPAAASQGERGVKTDASEDRVVQIAPTTSAQQRAAASQGEGGVKRGASEDREVEISAKAQRFPIGKARFGTRAERWIIEHATKWTQLPGGDRPWELTHSVEISTECWPQRGKLTGKFRKYNEELFTVGKWGTGSSCVSGCSAA